MNNDLLILPASFVPEKATEQELHKQRYSHVFLTLPEKQREWASDFFPKAILLDETDFFEASQYTKLNDLAREWAHQWYRIPEVSGILTYQGINLGDLIGLESTYAILGVLKAQAVYEALKMRVKWQRVYIVQDASYWTTIAGQVFGEAEMLSANASKASLKERSSAFKFDFKNLFKSIFQQLNRGQSKRVEKGGVLYSCALRYAAPFWNRGIQGVYLRDIFSFKAYQMSQQMPFKHWVVDDFYNSHTQVPDFDVSWNQLAKAIKEARFFQWEDMDLVDGVLIELKTIMLRRWKGSFYQIDAINRVLDRSAPRVIYLDEDICPFNRTLSRCAAMKGIPSLVMLNGVPFFEVGCLPLAANQIVVWGESSKKRLMDWGLEEKSIIEVGAPQYEELQDYNKELAKMNTSKELDIPAKARKLLIATQPFHTNERPDFLNSPITRRTIENLMLLGVRALRESADVYVIIKMHPREYDPSFVKKFVEHQKLSAEEQKRLRICQYEDTLQLIASSDLLVTIGSTVFFEALLLNTPVMICDDSGDRQFSFMVEEYLNLRDIDQSSQTISSFLERCDIESLETKRNGLIDRHFVNGNIGATDRIVKLLTEMSVKEEAVEASVI